MILDPPLDALARRVSSEDMAMYADLIDRVDEARATALSLDDLGPIMELYGGLECYLAGAYYLRDAVAFRNAVTAHQRLVGWIVRRFDPPPGNLLADLCLSLIHGPAPTRRMLVAAILTHGGTIADDDTSGILARILAATSNLDNSLATREATRLLHACLDRQYPRRDTRVLATFAVTVLRVNTADVERLPACLEKMDAARCALVEPELVRMQQGGSTAITANDLIDLPGAALAAIANARVARAVRARLLDTHFLDHRWMAGAGWA
ncbi:hypothetical protein [Burkholderia catarinensis]|uniref:hypothetical protein n=1 Tax=Burkholderia catarinensis TaxID=1108140 RepID=UPI000916B86D|nr:hypothetical protein [Burkholderia catarinensis]KAG8152908.1 hypothetical protein BFF94_013495 [Burkholderia catarinensis]